MGRSPRYQLKIASAALAAERPDRDGERARRKLGNDALQQVRDPEPAAMPRAEGAVGRERLAHGRVARQHAAQLAAARDPEVERAADPLRGEREAVPGGVSDEEASRSRRPAVADAG